jgi:hypothetical protein
MVSGSCRAVGLSRLCECQEAAALIIALRPENRGDGIWVDSGFRHCAAHDKTVSSFGRNDSFGFVLGSRQLERKRNGERESGQIR